MVAASESAIRNADRGIEMAFLRCQVQPSAFPHEVGVFITGVTQGYESIMDADLVQTEDLGDGQTHLGRVQIAIIQRDKEQDALLVELPRQVVMGGRRIWVPESEVEPRESHEHPVSESDQEATP